MCKPSDIPSGAVDVSPGLKLILLEIGGLIDVDFFMISYFVDRLRTIMITSKLNLNLPEKVFRSEPKVSIQEN